MAARNPPSWLQAGSHPAEHDRLVLEALVPQEGAVSSADLLVTERATPNMSVDVAAGSAFVSNDLAASGGAYHVYNDAVVNLPISAADPTNPRHDLVVAKVEDSEYAGGTDAWSLAVIAGTPAGSPADPAIPADASYLTLARVVVAAGATSITNAAITDLRPRAAVPANVATPVGAILSYAGTAAPAGWLLCNGAAVSRTTYAALFAVIGTTFGAGDGSSTFNVPDSRSRVVIGAGQGTGLTNRTLAGTGGAETHALTSGELPGHTHPGSTAVETQEHVHALNHVHSLNGGSHSHATDGDYGFRVAVTVGTGGHRIPEDSAGLGGQYVSFTDIDHEPILAPGDVGSTALTVVSQNGNSQGRSANHTHGVTVSANTGGGGAHNNMPPFVALNQIIRAF